MLQEQIVTMMRETTNKEEKDLLKVVVAEFQREKSKELDDVVVTSIIKRMVNNSKEVLKNARNVLEVHEANFSIKFLSTFLQEEEEVSDELIVEWITNNLDLAGAKNRLSLMKPLKMRFQSVDGDRLKNILQSV